MAHQGTEGSLQLLDDDNVFGDPDRAFSQIPEKSKDPRSEGEFKRIVRGAFWRWCDWTQWRDRGEWITQQEKDEMIRRINAAKSSNLSLELRSFMDDLREISGYDELWHMCFHPYISDAPSRGAYLDTLYDFFYVEQDQLRREVEPEFQANLGKGWKDEVWGITKQVLQFKGWPTNREGHVTYPCAIDSIRLWRNARVHYKKRLPRREREIEPHEIQERIFTEFPGGYEGIYQSMSAIIRGSYLTGDMREILLNKLDKAIKDTVTGRDTGRQGGERTGSVAGQPSQQMSARTREPTRRNERTGL